MPIQILSSSKKSQGKTSQVMCTDPNSDPSKHITYFENLQQVESKTLLLFDVSGSQQDFASQNAFAGICANSGGKTLIQLMKQCTHLNVEVAPYGDLCVMPKYPSISKFNNK